MKGSGEDSSPGTLLMIKVRFDYSFRDLSLFLICSFLEVKQCPVKLGSKLRGWCTRCEGFEMTPSATKDVNWTTEVGSR